MGTMTAHCVSLLMSNIILTILLYHLPEDQDERLPLSNTGHFFVFWLEVVFPLYLLFCGLLFLYSLMFWHLVISSNFDFLHTMPDYAAFQERLSSFPLYWKGNFQIEV